MAVQTDSKTRAEGYYKRGLVLKSNLKLDEALAAFEAAINEDFSFDPAFEAAADIFLEKGRVLEAADCYACAIKARPDSIPYKKKFIQAIFPFRFSQRNEDLRNIILQCLETERLDCSFLGYVWFSDICLSPVYTNLSRKTSDPAGFKRLFYELPVRDLFLDPFFLRGLERLVICNIEFEKFLTALRRFLLDEAGRNGGFRPDEYSLLVKALAQYCANTEYIFNVSLEEKAQLEGNCDEFIRACYRRGKPYKARKDIPSLTPIEDNVSQKVRGQYEDFPYPRWREFNGEIRHEGIEGRIRGIGAKILVAGCGTGREAVELASVFPDADVLAVDLSLASLSYGLEKAEEYGIKNITFKQGDILQLGVLEEKFDYIASSGVLHHMREPLKGWEILTGKLRQGGLMRVALYSRTARREIAAARKIIEREGISPDAEGIRFFRQQASRFLKKKTYQNITTLRDYYTMSECRDLLFHVQEHTFTLPEIKEALARLGLEFLGFYLPGNVFQQYLNVNPDDPKALDLDRWAAFENKNPDLFAGMYRFWCQKI